MCITSGEYAHEKIIFEKRFQQRTKPTDKLPKDIKNERVSDDVLFVHVYSTTSAKGSLRPATKAGIQL